MGPGPEIAVPGMVERAARALCRQQGVDADAPAGDAEPPAPNWRTFVPVVEAVLAATLLPSIPIAEAEPPGTHPGLQEWGRYRTAFGVAGAKAREPKLHKLTEWHVTAAWRTWNGMVEAALAWPIEQPAPPAPPTDGDHEHGR